MQFLSVAKGSLGELRSQPYIAVDQRYIDQPGFQAWSGQRSEIERMIAGLIEYLRGSTIKGGKYK